MQEAMDSADAALRIRGLVGRPVGWRPSERVHAAPPFLGRIQWVLWRLGEGPIGGWPLGIICRNSPREGLDH